MGSTCNKKTNIPANSLIKNYLPADYIDSFSQVIRTRQAIKPEEFRDLAFNQLPGWMDRLMRLRNTLVKPLGLDTKRKFTDRICDSSLHEEIFGMPDKHLDFYVSLYCGEHNEEQQELRMITAVKYNNRLGRIYFFIIKPFHGIIVKSILNRISKNCGRH